MSKSGESDKPLTIAFATPEYVTEKHYGGLATYLSKVSVHLKSLGHQPVVFVLSYENSSNLSDGVIVIRVSNIKPIWFWILNCLTLFVINTTLLTAAKSISLRNAINLYSKTNKIDLVQYSNAQFLSIFTPKIPNCLRLSHFYRIYGDYIYEKPKSFKNIQKRFLEIYCLKKANGRLYGPSSHINNLINLKTGLTPSLIRTPVIPNLDSPSLDETEVTKFLYFGTLSGSKGIGVLADILDSFLSQNPNCDFTALGRDTPLKLSDSSIIKTILKRFGLVKTEQTITYSSYLSQKVKRCPDRYNYAGVLSHTETINKVTKSNVVVLPSKIDNLPNTLTESLKLGKIVIVSSSSGLDEIIDDGKNGFIFSNNDAYDLLKVMTRVASITPNEIKVISDNAKKTVSKLMPDFVVKSELLTFYRNVVNNTEYQNLLNGQDC